MKSLKAPDDRHHWRCKLLERREMAVVRGLLWCYDPGMRSTSTVAWRPVVILSSLGWFVGLEDVAMSCAFSRFKK